VKAVPCPRCGTRAPYAPENPWRPFCTERCRIIDLGNWASEAYRMPVPIEPPADAEPGEK
jgi:hypothetical protein